MRSERRFTLFNINQRFKSGSLIFLAIVFLLLLKFLYPTSSKFQVAEYPMPTVDKLVQEASYSLNDSLPHYLYKKQLDSLKYEIQTENTYANFVGSGLSFLGFGVTTVKESNQKQYYFIVPHLFATDIIWFYYRGSKKIVEYNLWEKENDDVQFGQPMKEQTNFRFTYNKVDGTWKMGIPISKSYYNIGNVILAIMGLAFITICLYTLYLSLAVLFLIAEGKAFDDKAIRYLNIIALILLLVGFIVSTSNVVSHLIIKNKIPKPLTFFMYDDIMIGSNWIVFGLMMLLISKAFQSGRHLQQEIDLTV